MFALYLLLALITSQSIYAADTEEVVLIENTETTQAESEIIPLPDGLVTLVSSNNDNLKVDGFLFPPKDVAYISLLSLANPSRNSQENERRLERVQTLLREKIHDRLSRTPCSRCLDQAFSMGINRHQNEPICWGCKKHESNVTQNFPTTIIKDACTHLNKTLWQELSETKGVKDLYNQIDLYKVIGSLCLITPTYWTDQKLVSPVQQVCKLGKQISPTKNRYNKLSITIESAYIITTDPLLNSENIKDLFIEPLLNEFDSEEKIANAALPLLQKNINHNAKVAILDPKRVITLIEKYHQKPDKESCCTVS